MLREDRSQHSYVNLKPLSPTPITAPLLVPILIPGTTSIPVPTPGPGPTSNPIPIPVPGPALPDPPNSGPLPPVSGKPEVPSHNSTLLQDLERCSRAMGISEESLLLESGGDRSIEEVSRRAGLFLQTIQNLLPSEFSSKYRNPCWEAEQPIKNLHWESVLPYFQPRVGLKPRPHEKDFSRFILKPIRSRHGNKHSAKDSTLLCLPYFFLAGFPKSGSTTIHKVLQGLPRVLGPTEKEPHWWTRVLDLGKSAEDFDVKYLDIGFIAYTFFFKTTSYILTRTTKQLGLGSKEFITYDGSQSTLWDSNFYYNGQDYCAMPAVVSRVLPDAKFIVVMRNPVSRVYSHFFYSCKLHYGKVHKWPLEMRKKGGELFHREVKRAIDEFNLCTETMSVFECVSLRSSITETSDQSECGVVWHRLTIGLYAVHIKKWLQFYPQENFLFIKMEDISKYPFGTVSNITRFLNLIPASQEFVDEKIDKPQNILASSSISAMEQRTKNLLDKFYRPFNEELAKMLNDDRFLWKD